MEKVIAGYRCECFFCGKKFLIEPKDIKTYSGIEAIKCPHCGYDMIFDNEDVQKIWKK